MHVQFAKRRVAIKHFHGLVFVEIALEFFRRDVLNGVETTIPGKQAGAGEGSQDNGHNQVVSKN